jgi:hypothetical protein
MNQAPLALSPRQKISFDAIANAATQNVAVPTRFFHLSTRSGFGRTTILKRLQQELGANYLGMRDFVELQSQQHPLKIEESLFVLLEQNLDRSKPLILDDFHLLLKLGNGCSYPRAGYFESIGRALVELVDQRECQIIFGSNGTIPKPLKRVCYVHGVGRLEPEDYRHLVKNYPFGAR